jgi:hypothetical protein
MNSCLSFIAQFICNKASLVSEALAGGTELRFPCESCSVVARLQKPYLVVITCAQINHDVLQVHEKGYSHHQSIWLDSPHC